MYRTIATYKFNCNTHHNCVLYIVEESGASPDGIRSGLATSYWLRISKYALRQINQKNLLSYTCDFFVRIGKNCLIYGKMPEICLYKKLGGKTGQPRGYSLLGTV